ncbi:MAG TPA: peptidyl-prolyl cis-trans isomerase [Geminicoccaceae bacterium]|nr:peptidyl-prolyl cis-trans isomerase [Geminicoccaceae bacterium]
MLDAMRKRANSWFVRALLLVLIASFAVWGIGDTFFGRQDIAIAVQVGDIEVPLQEVDRAFEIDRRAFGEQFGATLDRRQAASLGILNRSLQNVIARALVDQHRRDLGIGVSDAEVAAAIRNDQRFATDGNLDRARFDMYLRSLGLGEAQYVEQVRADIGRARVLDALTGSIAAPSVLVERLGAWRGETRSGTLLEVASDAMTAPEPTDAELEAFLEENIDAFQAPEYRTVTLVTLTADDIVDEIEIDEARLREEYEARADFYTTPERRRVGQLLASDRETIEEARLALEEGAVFAELADSMADRGLTYGPLGPTAREDLPPEFADAIFALGPDEVSEPVQSAFGWHLFRLIEVEPETVRSFEDARDEIRRDLALDRAIDQLPDLASALDDGIAAGESLEEAALAVGTTARRFQAIDAQGRDATGAPVEGGAPSPEILAAIFAAPLEETSLLEETPGGTFYMFRVDASEPSRPRRLDEVRDDVAALWRQEERQRLATERVEAIMADARSGRTLETIAAGLGDEVTLRRFGPIGRAADGSEAGLTPEAVEALFATDKGNLAREPVATRNGSAILRTDAIMVPEGDQPELREQLTAALRNDVLIQYEAALRRRYPVEVNEAAIASLFPADEF